MLGGTLARYFGWRFISATLSVFAGIFLLVVLVAALLWTVRLA